MKKKNMPRVIGAALALVMGAAASSGCSAKVRASESNSYLIVDLLQAASGADPAKFGGSLGSDVLTFVPRTIDGKQVRVPTVFSDSGQVTLRLALKDVGTASDPTSPTTNNFITLTRYHVDFVRTDGRNTQGVDVPYGYDGALTVTVGTSVVTASFTLVRVQAKEELPLVTLAGNGGAQIISTIANITFYGTDQTGRAVSVTASISVNFADFGDPS
jgi:hypothetical protein